MAKTPSVGAPAPPLTLPGLRLVGDTVEHRDYDLSARSDGPLVIAFYPGDDTPVCTRQLCSYSSGLEAFTDLGAEVWAVSSQGLESHERFARKHGLRLPLLADTDKTAASAWGLSLLSGRSTFVVDGAGIVRWKDTRAGLTYAKSQRLTEVLAGLTPVG